MRKSDLRAKLIAEEVYSWAFRICVAIGVGFLAPIFAFAVLGRVLTPETVDNFGEFVERIWSVLLPVWIICGAVLGINYINIELKKVGDGASAVGVFLAALMGIFFMNQIYYWRNKRRS